MSDPGATPIRAAIDVDLVARVTACFGDILCRE
jgi:hypothetical protein